MVRAAQLLGRLTFEPQLRLGRAAQRAGAVPAGVVQPDTVIAVGAGVDVIAQRGGAAVADVPCRQADATFQTARRVERRIVFVKNPLYYARFHPSSVPDAARFAELRRRFQV